MYVDSSGCIRYSCLDVTKETKKKINSYVKHYLLESCKYNLYRLVQKANYYHDLYYNYDFHVLYRKCTLDFDYIVQQYNKYSKYFGYDLGLTDYELKCCNQLFNNKRKRILRLKKKLRFVITHYDFLFLTLTFRDSVLDSTSEKCRRVYISRFLRSLCVPFYVANIDYGDKEKNAESNEREHYHAIVQSNFIDTHLYKYGIIKVERITKNDLSVDKISTYINKLSHHAFKDSTGQCRLIYSKKKDFSLKQLTI